MADDSNKPYDGLHQFYLITYIGDVNEEPEVAGPYNTQTELDEQAMLALAQRRMRPLLYVQLNLRTLKIHIWKPSAAARVDLLRAWDGDDDDGPKLRPDNATRMWGNERLPASNSSARLEHDGDT